MELAECQVFAKAGPARNFRLSNPHRRMLTTTRQMVANFHSAKQHPRGGTRSFNAPVRDWNRPPGGVLSVAFCDGLLEPKNSCDCRGKSSHYLAGEPVGGQTK